MEFWGIEVKSGQPALVEPGDGMVLHLSQACLGEVKKNQSNEIVRLYVKKGDQKIILGNLSLEKFPQVSFDLVFEDEFELSHDWKHGSVHLAGYRSVVPEDEEDESDDDSDLGEPVPIHALNNGRLESKQAKSAPKPSAAAKPETGAAKPKVNFAEPSKTDEDSDDSEEDEDEDSEDEEGDSEEDEEMASAEDDDSEDSDEETPKKAEPTKKRAADSATKTPVSNKKSKLLTPQKTDGKKASVHVATPHPAKQAGKTPANNSEKSKQQSPKSGGSYSCGSCSKAFGSEQALQSHSKAKHAAK